MQQDQQVLPIEPAPPIGIQDRHLGLRWPPWARPLLQLLILGLPILAALLGVLGGGPHEVSAASSDSARVVLQAPHVLRTGNWFENRIIVEPRVDVADLTIAIDRQLWQHMSIDTLYPDAENAESADGEFSFSFGDIKRGERFMLKLDGQIQPYGPRRLHGMITIRDGERDLVSLPHSLWVLP